MKISCKSRTLKSLNMLHNQVIWGYANMTGGNYELRSLFSELHITYNIHFTLGKLAEHMEVKADIINAFAVYLSYYFGTYPYLEYAKVG
jgi:hypothetical protein